MDYVRLRRAAECRPGGDGKPLLSCLDIELTERCNNACIHCYINLPEQDSTARAREMDTAFVKDVLRQAASLGCLDVRFTGGEPLLREDFVELYVFARRLGTRVTLFTNGRCITPELAELLARMPPGSDVEVTVYGTRAESYDAVAGSRGAFVEFSRGLELLRLHSVPLVVKQSVLPPNRDEMAGFGEFAAKHLGMPKSPSYVMTLDLRARRDLPAKNRVIEKLRLTPAETVSMLACRPHYLTNRRELAGSFMAPPGDRLFACGAGQGTVCLDAYGTVQMCMGLRHPGMVCNLRATVGKSSARIGEDPGMDPGPSLRYVLADLFPRLRQMRSTNPEYLARCARCFLKGLCEQCPAKSWQEHGTLDTPVDYLCQVAHAQARYLGLVAEEEHGWDVVDWRQRTARFASGTG